LGKGFLYFIQVTSAMTMGVICVNLQGIQFVKICVTQHTQCRPGHSSWSQIVISFTSSVYAMHNLQT